MNNKMLNTTKLLGVTALLASSVNVFALQSTATVKVKNAFDLAETTAFNLGTIRANADGTASSTKSATLVIDPETGIGAATDDAPATIGQLTAGTPGEFTVTGLGAYTNLKIVDPGTAELKLTPHPSGGAFFKVSAFKFLVTTGNSAGNIYDGTTDLLTAGADGTATFKVGATIATTFDTDAATQYQDADYTGTYEVKVEY